MRIVHVTSLHAPFDARIFAREAVSLARAGHEVIVVAPHMTDARREGVRLVAVPVPRTRFERMTRTAAQVWRAALACEPDVLHVHDAELLPGALVALGRGRRVVYDLHEDWPRTFAAKGWVPAPLRAPLAALAEWFEDAVCRRCDALVAATPAIAERAMRANPRCALVRNFPRLAEFAAPEPGTWHARDRAIAYVGGIAENRGALQMLDALGALPSARRTVLRLAGTFETEELRRAAERHPAWPRAEALGFLDRAAVGALLAHVRVGLVLLHPEPRYQVAWPVKLFEYMAAGVPVVASDFPLWRSIVEPAGCGLLVDPLDSGAIAAAITRLLDDSALAEAMGQRGRAAVEAHWCWNTEEARLLELYSTLENGIRS